MEKKRTCKKCDTSKKKKNSPATDAHRDEIYEMPEEGLKTIMIRCKGEKRYKIEQNEKGNSQHYWKTKQEGTKKC